jgi:filamentous hemagglutinin
VAGVTGTTATTTATAAQVAASTYVTATAVTQAAITTLASQATISLINNGGRLDETLKELGSKDNLKQLATSLVTAGVLSGLGNAITVDGKALNSINATDGFAANVGKNLVTGLARASITSAITGTDLETSLRTEVIASILNAASAQGANFIGDQAQTGAINEFGRAFAHAVAGCAAGAAGAGASGSGTSGGSGCGAGALGAVVGEFSAQLYGADNPAKTIAFASMMSGIAAAAAGLDAQGVAIAASTGANAAENNRLLHINERTLIAQLAKNQAKQDCRGDAQCESVLTLKWTDTLEHVATGLVDDQANAQNLHYLQTVLQTATIPGSAGAMGGAASYLADMQTAQALLAPYTGKTITVNGVTVTSDGAAQTYFSATPAQRADPLANDVLGQAAGAIAPGMAQRDANRIASLSVQNGTAQPVYPVEEAVLGGMVADRVVSAATRWIGSLDVALAGKVGASNGGNLSAQQITRAGIPARLSTAEQGTLATIVTLPDTALQGAAREYVANSYFTRNGFTPLEGKCGSGNCFDGVYVKGNTVYINEVKPLNANGSIKLSGSSGTLPTQMTDAWISSAIGRLKEGTPVQRQTAAAIEKVLNTPNLVKVVTGVNSNGMTIVKLQ